jgi:ketosteroid isomerase-like protein
LTAKRARRYRFQPIDVRPAPLSPPRFAWRAPDDRRLPVSEAELRDLVVRFTDAFNRDDLDAVMAFLADDAIYDEFNGKRSRGKAAIRETLVPQFRGDLGRIRFEAEDLFVDPVAGKALIRWRCARERNGTTRSWRGLDVLHVRDGRITEKHTSATADVPRREEA